MDTRTLKYFLAIAREQNMTTAADTLHVTQPTLSRQMSDLENSLGKKLFTRTNRQTLLTEDGMFLRKRAEEILSLIERTEKEFRSTAQDVYGEIYIGAGETPIMSMIANAALNLHEQHPHIQYHLYSAITDDILEKLNRGLLDFALLVEPVDKEKLEYISIFQKDRIGILVRDDSPYAEKQTVTKDDLKGMPLLISSRNFGVGYTWADRLKLHPTEMNIVGTGNLIYNIAFMVQKGIANAICIEGLDNISEYTHLKFVPIEPVTTLNYIFAWKKYQILSQAEELFLEKIRAELTIN